jgi:hypothetical protein
MAGARVLFCHFFLLHFFLNQTGAAAREVSELYH